MLLSLKQLNGYTLQGQDGDIGTVKDFYFDDAEWIVRYLVASTGHWLPGPKVLISKRSLDHPEWTSKKLMIDLTREEIEHSPSIHTDKPVSRQKEKQLHDYFTLPYYWGARVGAAGAPDPAAVALMAARRRIKEQSDDDDPHLRSLNEVTGYSLTATDDEIGKVVDLIADTDQWSVHYMVVDTGHWLPGQRVLVALDWVECVDWDEQTVRVDLNSEAIKQSPEFNPATPVNREYEERLYDYYGRPRYWL